MPPAAATEYAVATMVHLGAYPHEVVVDHARGVAYASVPSRDEIVTVSLDDGAILERAFVGRSPYGIALSRNGDTLFAALNGSGSVAARDLETGVVTTYNVTQQLGDARTWDVIQPVAGEVWVSSNPGSNGFAYIVRLDLGTGTGKAVSYIIRAAPEFATDGNFVYVGEGFSPNSLYRFSISPPALVAEDDHGAVSGTFRYALSPDGSDIVTTSGQRLSAASLRPYGSYSAGMPQYSADGKRLYVATTNWSPSVSIEIYDASRELWLDTIATSCRTSSSSSFSMSDFDRVGSGRFLIAGSNMLCLTQPVSSPPTCAGRTATIFGTDAEDTLTGGYGDDVIVGYGGNDVIEGYGGNDLICGGSGDDTIRPAEGNDEVYAGDGRDTVTYANSSYPVVVHLPTDSVEGSGVGEDVITGVEVVVATQSNDVMIGDAEANALLGGGGDDTIFGRLGDDDLSGGDGADTLSYAGADSPVSVDLILGTASGQGSDTVSGFERVVGTSRADQIRGDLSANVLQGGGGSDSLRGETGDDVLLGGWGNDTLAGGLGNDRLNADIGNDGIDGGEGWDVADFGAATTGVRVDLEAQTATGQGSDTITGVEEVLGSALDDILLGAPGTQWLVGNDGNDRIFGRVHNDLLRGGSGHDRLGGGYGDDEMHGDMGNDLLDGGPHYDVLNGADGTDSCRRGEQVYACES